MPETVLSKRRRQLKDSLRQKALQRLESVFFEDDLRPEVREKIKKEGMLWKH